MNGPSDHLIGAYEAHFALRDLEGTPKQVAWARSLRVLGLQELDHRIAIYSPGHPHESVDALRAEYRGQRSCKWWIEEGRRANWIEIVRGRLPSLDVPWPEFPGLSQETNVIMMGRPEKAQTNHFATLAALMEAELRLPMSGEPLWPVYRAFRHLPPMRELTQRLGLALV